jgi:hypothetical protein
MREAGMQLLDASNDLNPLTAAFKLDQESPRRE